MEGMTTPPPSSMPGMPHVPDGGHGTTDAGMHMMSPFLFTRTENFFVLFKEAHIHSTGAFVGALLLSALFALVATVVSQVARIYEVRALRGKGVAAKLFGSSLFGLRQALHYIAMLIVMTMNVWLILAVVLGHACGWLLYSVAMHDRFGGGDEVVDGIDVDAKHEASKLGVGCDC